MVGVVSVTSSAAVGTHGVLFLSPHEFVLYDYPGATTTYFTDINSHGLVCGNYTDNRNNSHGFIARVRLATAE
jgi:hypothetical protein